jgi:hypothetical protein
MSRFSCPNGKLGWPIPWETRAPQAVLVVATGIATTTKSMISATSTNWIFSTAW